jgi:hypothetical protein
MGRLIVSEFVTLGGVIEGPGHDEHRGREESLHLKVGISSMAAPFAAHTRFGVVG